ncbi:hypothetical protein PoB_000965300 [Plakobranchus ocellatus]|uniref:Uncharacterized protein n=1 Tax=Plakobranchus ocellatus TaxID=259542 RepID=A0AAV3YKS8_9GAST|nr:hypothetical protein PoB_000965300 [Plakobranchus ocellatus]
MQTATRGCSSSRRIAGFVKQQDCDKRLQQLKENCWICETAGLRQEAAGALSGTDISDHISPLKPILS